jgi:hypothetical protein
MYVFLPSVAVGEVRGGVEVNGYKKAVKVRELGVTG